MTTSLDEKVEVDFVFFLEHFQESFDSLKSKSDKEICQKWLDKLVIEKYKDTNEKQIRNIYLSQLIINMNERKLSAPFNESPKLARLSLDGVFKHITTKSTSEVEHEKAISENQKNWQSFIRNRELEVIDMNHMSIDGSTYIACKTLAENSGIFAYVAVTLGGKTDQGWVNTCGQPIPVPVIQPLDLQVETTNSRNNKNEHDDKLNQITVEVKAILSKRKTVEARVLTQQFFQRIYNNIEQEMLREEDPNSTACHDPYVEKLLEMLINEKRACGKFDPFSFKKIKMLSLLKKRVNNTLIDIEIRNKNLANIEVASTSPMLTLTNPASTCSNSMTRMMWQGASMEKPTSKMAEALAKTYPACLIKMLLALMVRERRSIISRLQEKQENLILDMKRDLQNEIKQGILNYKVARTEWVDVMRVVLHYNKLKEMLTEKDGNSLNDKGYHLQDTIRKEIKNTKEKLEMMNRKTENLQNDIHEANRKLHEIIENTQQRKLQNAENLRDLQIEISNEQSSITSRYQSIEGLEKMLKEKKL